MGTSKTTNGRRHEHKCVSTDINPSSFLQPKGKKKSGLITPKENGSFRFLFLTLIECEKITMRQEQKK